MHQLLSVILRIYKAFGASPLLEVRAVFLDLTKAFRRVWHESFMHDLKHMGIFGKSYGFIHCFLNDRRQRVVLIGRSSNWSHIEAGLPQGSILGPLLFLVYISLI